MTVKELLVNVPDNLPVMVMVENHLKPGMFAFAEACLCDTGISELGPANEDGTGGGESAFLILPHGSGVPEDEIGSKENQSPELN